MDRARILLSLVVVVAALGCGDPVVNIPEPLVVIHIPVNDGGHVGGLRPRLVFGFNKAVTLNSLQENGNLVLEAVGTATPAAPGLTAGLSNADDAAGNTIWIEPAGELAAAGTYLLTLKSGGEEASGLEAADGARLAEDYDFHFQTCPAENPDCAL